MLRQMMEGDEEGGLERREKLLSDLIDELAVIPELKEKLGGGEAQEGAPDPAAGGEAKVSVLSMEKSPDAGKEKTGYCDGCDRLAKYCVCEEGGTEKGPVQAPPAAEE